MGEDYHGTILDRLLSSIPLVAMLFRKLVLLCLLDFVVALSLSKSMRDLGFSVQQQTTLKEQWAEVGMPESALWAIVKDMDSADEVSSLLKNDLGLPTLVVHQTRAVVAHARELYLGDESLGGSTLNRIEEPVMSFPVPSVMSSEDSEASTSPKVNATRPIFKKTVVNPTAKDRKQAGGSNYGLPVDCSADYPQIAKELNEWYSFMTKATILAQEEPLRPSTAKPYLRHARLFLGWYVRNHAPIDDPQKLSIFDIIPNSKKESAQVLLDFIVWLRSDRQISVSYEANMIRGLIKLLKFRFARETTSEKSFDDIGVVRELRSWHRLAQQKTQVAPRSSREDQKWLSWPQYLKVVEAMLADLEQLQNENAGDYDIAVALQKYLILAILSNVPDRQRTIRELQVGRSLVFENDRWCIKHRPEDYKTGKKYGERPLLPLSPDLTPYINDFVERWRPVLKPSSAFLFVQPRSGKPLTRDSVYQIVSRACYQHTGQRTNPHLLRDMIVTHVRESGKASEAELEALALYMGHSIQVQRANYDRRTLQQKVAPAVELLQNVNSKSQD